MAHVQTNRVVSADITDRLYALIEQTKEAYAKWRVYRVTLNELQSLSNRELADLGIARAEIRHLASKAAYGA